MARAGSLWGFGSRPSEGEGWHFGCGGWRASAVSWPSSGAWCPMGGPAGRRLRRGGLELDGLKASCARDALPLPAGWRHASGTEAGGEWRGRDRCRYRVVKADLDGDGIRDQAELLVSEGGAEFGPFAFLRQRDATYRVLRLGEPMPREYLEVMGIRAVKPGFYRTACGKGYVACGAGEPKAVRLKAWAIDVFTEESANSFFYWDGHAALFRRVWISD